MHAPPKRPKLAENVPRAPLLPCAPNGPAAHLQAAPPAAHASGCRCVRHARLAQEWDEHRWLSWPLGVDEMLARGPSGAAAAAPRFHATFAGSVHLGCFATAAEAAGAWDAEARRRGQRVVNAPRAPTAATGEVSLVGHLRAALAALPSHALPPLPSDQAWRAAELAALLAVARAPDGGGLERMWADDGGVGVGGSVAQHDHCSAAGVQLCWSYNAHAGVENKPCLAGQRGPSRGLAEAGRSLGCNLALEVASGEPAGRSLSHPWFHRRAAGGQRENSIDAAISLPPYP